MLRRLGSFFSYANVVATLALFVAMGGVSYAAVTIADGSVTTRKLAANAVTSPKIKDGQVASQDLAPAVRDRLAATYTKTQSDGRYLRRAGSISVTEPLTGWAAAIPTAYGVQAHAVCPSYFRTPLIDNMQGTDVAVGAVIGSLVASSPVSADDIAAAVLAGVDNGEELILPDEAARAAYGLKTGDRDGYNAVMRKQAARLNAMGND